ncbi:MAG TPA: VOC family protein [Candidatus Limnocylindrales bacterium]|nr:VOC family protein [Candidatus Limnocylindrales bacterium]
MTTADAPRILRLQHVSLPFPGTPESVVEARRFYGEILGLEERPVPPTLPGVVVWFAAGDQELHLFSEPSGVEVNDRSRRHPCFQVDDVARLRAHLDATGVPTRDHDGEIPGRPRFFARDPFGNTIEFVTFEPNHW